MKRFSLSLSLALLPALAFLIVAPLRAANQARNPDPTATHVVVQTTHDLTVVLQQLEQRMRRGNLPPDQWRAIGRQMGTMAQMLNSMGAAADKGMVLSAKDREQIDRVHAQSKALVGGGITNAS